MLFGSQGYPSPSCCNSSPNNSTSFSCSCLSSCNLFTFSHCWLQTCVAEVSPVVAATEFIHKGRSRGVAAVQLFLCCSTSKSSLLLLLPPWLSAGFPSVKRAFPHCHCCPSRAGSSVCHVWVCQPVPGHVCPVLSPLCRSWAGWLSCLECPRFCVAAILQCLHGDASPRGSTLSRG